MANNKIGRITPAGVITEFQLPLNGQGQSSQPVAILVGPDGALWFTMSSASRIGRTIKGKPITATASAPVVFNLQRTESPPRRGE